MENAILWLQVLFQRWKLSGEDIRCRFLFVIRVLVLVAVVVVVQWMGLLSIDVSEKLVVVQ